jgi:hypothetical protein
MNTNTAIPSAISGTPINTSSPQKPIGVSEKKQEKRPILNDGTTRYANELAGTFDKRCPFPNLMSIIICSPRGLLLSIMRANHLPSNHYQRFQHDLEFKRGRMGFQFLGHEIYLRLDCQYILRLIRFPLWGQAPMVYCYARDCLTRGTVSLIVTRGSFFLFTQSFCRLLVRCL